PNRRWRVFLRFPTAADADEFVALRRASRAFLAQWEPRPSHGVDFYSRESFLTHFLPIANTETGRRILVCRIGDSAILGEIGLSQIVLGAFHSAYMGYWIGAPFARQGYMTEGLSLALEYAFRRVRLHRVEANIQPRNLASIAL